MIAGVLEDAGSAVKKSANGNWTRYELTIGGKRYQVKQPVYEEAGRLMFQNVLADVEMRMNGEWENWYANAVFDANDPDAKQQLSTQGPMADTPGVRTKSQTTAQAAGLVTEMAKHEGIARMAAVKHLVEGGFPGIASEAFMEAARTLSTFYLYGLVTGPEEPEEPYVHPDEDPDIPFMPTIYDNNH
jgi:hypothetical protein